MRIEKLLIACFFILFSSIGELKAETISLSLKEALLTALKENNRIPYAHATINISDNEIDFERGIYDPSFNMSGTIRRQKQGMIKLSDLEERDEQDYDISLKRKHSYGGTSSVGFSALKTEENFHSDAAEDEHESEIFLRHELPILRDAGRTITNLDIHKAGIEKKLAEQNYEETKSQVLADVFQSFFDRYKVSRRISILREIKQNSRELERIIREQVALRSRSITSYNRIVARILTQDRQIQNNLNTKQQRENQLLLSIYNDSKAARAAQVKLTTSPQLLMSNTTIPPINDTLLRAQVMNITMIRLLVEKELLEADLLEAKNNIKPDLNLALRAGMDSSGTDSWADSVVDFSGDNYSVRIGAELSFPFYNSQARSRLAKIQNRQEQSKISIANQRTKIEKIIHELYLSLETASKVKNINQELTMVTRQNLNDEIERLRAGKSTVLDILSHQTDLNNAELSLLDAEVNYLMLYGELRYLRREMESFIRIGNDNNPLSKKK